MTDHSHRPSEPKLRRAMPFFCDRHAEALRSPPLVFWSCPQTPWRTVLPVRPESLAVQTEGEPRPDATPTAVGLERLPSWPKPPVTSRFHPPRVDAVGGLSRIPSPPSIGARE